MTERDRVANWLRMLVDGGLLAVLLIAPLFMGGRHPWGRLVLAIIVATMGIAWGTADWLDRRSRWTWSGGEGLLLLAASLVILQLVPLPSALLRIFAPALSELLPLWSAESGTTGTVGCWDQISLHPQATREGLCLLLTYGVLFLVSYQRLQRPADVERVVRWLAVASVWMASLGLIQYSFGNGKFLWIYAHPSRDTFDAVKGTFANQNHFAHFLALGLGPLAWWLHRSLPRRVWNHSHGQPCTAPRRGSTLFVVGGLTVVSLAILLSFSRGAVMSAGCGILVWLIIQTRRRQIDRRVILVLTAACVIVLLVLAIHGRERLTERIATLASGSWNQLDGQAGRRKVWSAVLRAVPEFALVGSGVGSFRDVYPRYYPHWSAVEYTHAESGYLQVLLETGMSGFLLLLASWGLVGRWLRRALRPSSSDAVAGCAAALAASCCVSLVHSVVDFVWYLPACMSVIIIVVAASARLSQLAVAPAMGTVEHRSSNRPAGLFALAVAGLAICGVRVFAGPALAAPHWEDYLAISLAAGTADTPDARVGRQLGRGEVQLNDPRTLEQMAAHLRRALTHHPHDARAELRYATVRLRQFELAQQSSRNAMSLLDIRQAAQTAGFATRQDQDRWLSVVLAERRVYLNEAIHASARAVQLSPLQGQGYLHLAELTFLQQPSRRIEQRLLDQAERVRPYDGTVLFCRGRAAVFDGDWEAGLADWQQAFRHGPEVRQTIIEAVAPQVEPDVFLTIFEPDREGLAQLFRYYRQSDQRLQAQRIGQRYVQVLEQHARTLRGADAARHWNAIQEIYGYLEMYPAAASAARQAVRTQPGEYRLHYLLGVRLWQSHQWDEALQQFRWCLNRRPKDPLIQRKVAETRRDMRLSRTTPAAVDPSSTR